MKRNIKSYLVFTSMIYRIVVFLLLPVLSMGLYCLVKDVGTSIGLVVIMELLMMAEIFLDNWLFGGIQSKDSEKLDYLKTSARGMQVMKSALRLDMVRRFLTAVIVLVGCYLIKGVGEISAAAVGYLILVSYTISVLGVFVARYEGGMWVNMVIGYIALIVGLLSLCLPGFLGHAKIWMLCFAVLAILVSILAVRVAAKKVEGSYYDK